MRKGWVAMLMAGCILSACSEEGFPEIVEEKEVTHHIGEQAEISTYASQEYTWHEVIFTIANNGKTTAEKFEELEQFSVTYVTNAYELEQFTDKLIRDFESYTYTKDLTNEQDVLTRIFQAFIVERNATGALKDFSAAYYANLTALYKDNVSTTHDAILHNERIMKSSLATYKEDSAT